MAAKFFVPKFITIEDKLAGILTFKQLFSLLGAFMLTFFVFKMNQLIGVIVGIVSFGIAIIFTFVRINGKLFVFIVPDLLDFLFKSKKFAWQRIERIVYKEVELPEAEEEVELKMPRVIKRERMAKPEKVVLEINYPEVAPDVKEKVEVSLTEPIATQAENISKIVHHHLVNPKNPYRLFPYIKFYKTLK